MADLEASAELAYRAFCASRARSYLPPIPPSWAELPEIVKEAWRDVAKALLLPS